METVWRTHAHFVSVLSGAAGFWSGWVVGCGLHGQAQVRWKKTFCTALLGTAEKARIQAVWVLLHWQLMTAPSSCSFLASIIDTG